MMTTIHKMTGYALGAVAANVVLQVVMVLLLTVMFERFGLLLSVVMALGYVGMVTLIHFCLTPYYNMRRHEDARQEMLQTVGNLSWRSVALTMMLVIMAQSLWCATIGLYFFDYVNAQSLMSWLSCWSVSVTSENVFTIGLIAFIVVAIVAQLFGAVFFTNYLSRHLGKKGSQVVCLGLTALFSLLSYMPQSDEITLVFVLCVLKSLAFGPVVPLLWTMTGDVANHLAHQHQLRATGFCYSGVLFALKLGLGLGIALGGLLLTVFGYLPEADGLQSWTAMQGIRFISSFVPAMLFTVAVMAFWSYPYCSNITLQINDKNDEKTVSFTSYGDY